MLIVRECSLPLDWKLHIQTPLSSYKMSWLVRSFTSSDRSLASCSSDRSIKTMSVKNASSVCFEDIDKSIANWKIPGKMVKGMGGAMDLVASAKNIIVAMQHVNKNGESKLLPSCTLPLTGVRCVKKIVTELGVFDVLEEGGFKLIERAPGVSVDDIKKATAGKLIVEGDVPEMVI